MKRALVSLLAAIGCVGGAPTDDVLRRPPLVFAAQAAITPDGPHLTAYVRARGETQLYALVDRDGDRRVDEMLPVGAPTAQAPTLVIDELPRSGHGFRYLRYGDQLWLYLPLDIMPSVGPRAERSRSFSRAPA